MTYVKNLDLHGTKNLPSSCSVTVTSWMFSQRFGYMFQTCGFKMVEKQKSMYLRNFPIIKMDRLFPSLAKKTLFKFPSWIVIYNGGKGKVGIFIGCLANYMYTDIGKSLLEILKELQIDAYLIKQQKCCGAPQYFTGDFDSVDFLAKFNTLSTSKVL